MTAPASSRRARAALAGTVLLVLLVVAACGSAASPSPAGADPIRVVATTTVLADLVRNTGGDRVVVESLVPAGAEPHTFAPRPSDLRKIADADVIVMNGLGLDDWLRPLAAEAKRADATLVELAPDLPGVTYLPGDAHAEGAGTANGEAVNPHLWLDAAYAQAYVDRIAEALVAAHPADADAVRASAAAYSARLADLDSSIRARLAALPSDHRRVVSFHDAFPYYAAAYGLDVAGVVVPVPGQEPSASEVAALIDAIRTSGVRAILAEAQFSPRVADQLAAETGVHVVSSLYTDSLGDAPADSYVGIMEWDTDRLVEALR